MTKDIMKKIEEEQRLKELRLQAILEGRDPDKENDMQKAINSAYERGRQDERERQAYEKGSRSRYELIIDPLKKKDPFRRWDYTKGNSDNYKFRNQF